MRGHHADDTGITRADTKQMRRVAILPRSKCWDRDEAQKLVPVFEQQYGQRVYAVMTNRWATFWVKP